MTGLEIVKPLYIKNQIFFDTESHAGITVASKFGTVYTVADATDSYFVIVDGWWDFYGVVRVLEEWGSMN